jgi:hypothetical protein
MTPYVIGLSNIAKNSLINPNTVFLIVAIGIESVTNDLIIFLLIVEIEILDDFLTIDINLSTVEIEILDDFLTIDINLSTVVIEILDVEIV